jgi:hypothetical protein
MARDRSGAFNIRPMIGFRDAACGLLRTTEQADLGIDPAASGIREDL